MSRATALSRNLRSSQAGKCDAWIDKFRVPSEVKDILVAEAAKVGMAPPEFLRELLTMRALGPDHVKKVQSDRLDQVWGKFDERGRRG